MAKRQGGTYNFSNKFMVRLLETPSERQVFARVEVLEDSENYKKGDEAELNVDFMY